MPELPEVETVVRSLRPVFIGQTVAAVWCNWPRLASPSLVRLQERLVGLRIADISRRAKFIVMQMHNLKFQVGHVLIHLRMSGRLEPRPRGTKPAKHVHFTLCFTRGPDLHFDDARKFGRVLWTTDLPAATAHLGIEPLGPEFTIDWLAAALRARSRILKPALLDQSLVAGLGNIYTDEALHAARLHPTRKTDSLRREEIARLHAAVVAALEAGIRNNGASIDWVYPGGSMQDHFAVYGRAEEPCPRCRTDIRRIVVAQRGTHFCPRCQPAPRR